MVCVICVYVCICMYICICACIHVHMCVVCMCAVCVYVCIVCICVVHLCGYVCPAEHHTPCSTSQPYSLKTEFSPTWSHASQQQAPACLLSSPVHSTGLTCTHVIMPCFSVGNLDLHTYINSALVHRAMSLA